MNQLTFTVEDCKDPSRLERLLRQMNLILESIPPEEPKPPSPQALAVQLAPLIRTQLQAPGAAPLNLQSLLPESGLGVVLEDTHSNRLTLHPASSTNVGALFWETDRTVLYVVTETAGVRSWTYAAGMYQSAFASRPTDLGLSDAGFLYMPGTYLHICRWSGAAWAIPDGGGGYIVDAVAALGAGWQLCDGTATTYLTISGADLAETAFTTPDENSGVAGVYHESIAAYTGTINAATAPGISGSVANTTATNQAATATNQNESAHTHAVDPPVTTTSGPSTTFAWVPDGGGVSGAADNHTHTVDIASFTSAAGSAHTHTQDSHNHTQDAHLHGVGTLAVDAAGEPRRMGVLRYFRR